MSFRLGSKEDVKSMVSQVLALIIGWIIFGIGTSGWTFFGLLDNPIYWNPPGFDPWSYWNLSEAPFWDTFVIFLPLAFYIPLIAGQLSWLSSDALLEKTYGYKSPSLGYLAFRGGFAGVIEELSYRGVFIYTAMLGIVISNTIFIWLIGFFVFALAISIVSKMRGAHWTIKFGVFGAFVWGFFWLNGKIGLNPIYWLYEYFYIPVYRWILSPENFDAVAKFLFVVWVILTVIYILIKLALAYAPSKGTIVERMRQHQANEIFSFSVLVRSIATSAIVFGIILWTISLTDPNTVLAGPFLLVAAITSAALKFGDGHKYQGFTGVWKAIAFGFYMTSVAFTYGLLYAIVVHACFDIVLMLSEGLIVKYRMRNVKPDPTSELLKALLG